MRSTFRKKVFLAFFVFFKMLCIFINHTLPFFPIRPLEFLGCGPYGISLGQGTPPITNIGDPGFQKTKNFELSLLVWFFYTKIYFIY